MWMRYYDLFLKKTRTSKMYFIMIYIFFIKAIFLFF